MSSSSASSSTAPPPPQREQPNSPRSSSSPPPPPTTPPPLSGGKRLWDDFVLGKFHGEPWCHSDWTAIQAIREFQGPHPGPEWAEGNEFPWYDWSTLEHSAAPADVDEDKDEDMLARKDAVPEPLDGVVDEPLDKKQKIEN